jgi:N-hydroxyarylamine O-acetyltransferase
MPIDLKAYTERIEHKCQLAPNLATLQALHLAHATHITFENLDVLMGKPIRLDLESLAAKLFREVGVAIASSRTLCSPERWRRSAFV